LRRFFGKVPSPGRKCQPIENIDEFRLTDRSVNQPGQPIENIDESRLTDRSVNQPGQPIENIDESRLIDWQQMPAPDRLAADARS
jgi:hypothetical protein